MIINTENPTNSNYHKYKIGDIVFLVNIEIEEEWQINIEALMNKSFMVIEHLGANSKDIPLYLIKSIDQGINLKIPEDNISYGLELKLKQKRILI